MWCCRSSVCRILSQPFCQSAISSSVHCSVHPVCNKSPVLTYIQILRLGSFFLASTHNPWQQVHFSWTGWACNHISHNWEWRAWFVYDLRPFFFKLNFYVGLMKFPQTKYVIRGSNVSLLLMLVPWVTQWTQSQQLHEQEYKTSVSLMYYCFVIFITINEG